MDRLTIATRTEREVKSASRCSLSDLQEDALGRPYGKSSARSTRRRRKRSCCELT